jgi:hypothetical protein
LQKLTFIPLLLQKLTFIPLSKIQKEKKIYERKGINGKENGNGGECVRKRRRKSEKKNTIWVIIKSTRFVSSEVDLRTL